MRVLLLSTYELGQQPLGIAVPAAALEAAGHEVFVSDLSREDWPAAAVAVAEAAVVSIPMHTATLLAIPVIRRLRAERPGVRVALHGLYAPVLADHDVLAEGDLLVAGDPVPALLGWLAGDRPGGLVTDLGPARPEPAESLLPRRAGLPPLERYARRLGSGTPEEGLLVGSVATSHGCNHRCGHCPVAAVYGGRSRPVPADAVLADVAQLVAAGAGHVTFADPDFLNRPRHALEVARRLAAEHPGISFDATVKVEHLCRHASMLDELVAAGLSFVVSAFESVDEAVLRYLDKGHVVEDEVRAVRIVRRSGAEIRPSWLPFTPWSTVQSVGDLLTFSALHDLVESTDPVQYSIRLLLPAGSLLLEQPDPVLAASLGELDPESGSTRWSSADPALDALQLELAAIAEAAAATSAAPGEAFVQVWAAARTAGADLPPEPPSALPASRSPLAGPDRPRLSEPWFCCAEPTSSQLELVTTGTAATR